MSKPSPASLPDSAPTATSISELRSNLWSLQHHPGIYVQCKATDSDAVRCVLSGPNGAVRTSYMRRDRVLEAALASTMRLETVTDHEMFVCDLCGCPARTVAFDGDEAHCPRCLDKERP